jgi:hypothetical protein
MKLAASCCAAIFSLVLSTGAIAAPITFNFVFNLPPPNAASRGDNATGRYATTPAAPQGNLVPTMSGSITFESTLLANPGDNSFPLPNPAVLALNVTVTNSGAGDGTFGLNDFAAIVFDTNGGTLNFNQQLVGQPTDGDPWGTPSSNGGDFNLFIARAVKGNAPSGNTLPPDGVFFFTLGSNGGSGPAATLGSMTRAVGVPVVAAPSLGGWALTLLAGMLGFGASLSLRRANRGV